MTDWLLDIIREHKELVRMFVNLGMCNARMIEVAIKVIKADTLDFNFVLPWHNFNLEWNIALNECEGPFGMLYQCSVSTSALAPHKTIVDVTKIGAKFLEWCEQHSKPDHVLNLSTQLLLGYLLFEIFDRFHISIAV